MNIIFFHVALMGNWQEIFNELWEKIIESDLINDVSKIYIGIAGNGNFNIDSEKVEVFDSGGLESYEFLTLRKLIKFCKEYPTSRVLYIHTKGVSTTLEFRKAIDDWRHYMAYFVIENYKTCLKKLESFDVCGVDWVEYPTKHFSGNFWWANASYVNSLPNDWEDRSILTKRHNCEFLIGMNDKVKSCSLHDSNIDVYQRHLHRYGKENYEIGRTCS